MAISGLLKKIKEEEIFEKHPCRELDLESKIHYLNGLALVMNEDDDIDDTEKKYLGILVNTFGLNVDQTEESIAFAQNPDDEIVMEMLKAFKSKEIKHSFMMDCLMIAKADGNFNESEKVLIEQFFELYEFTVSEKKELMSFFEKLQAKDEEAILKIFEDNKNIKHKRFEYLFEYMNINIIFNDEANIKVIPNKDKMLEFNFIEPQFSIGELDEKCRVIADKPVNNEQFCIFLNEMYQEEKIKKESNGDIIVMNTGNLKAKDNFTNFFSVKSTSLEGRLVLSSENNEIIFTDNNIFIPAEKKEKSKIVYVTIVGVRMFIAWISEYHQCKYALMDMDGDGKGMLTTRYVVDYGNSFMNYSIHNEFYESMSDYFILDEENTYKGNVLLWSTDSSEDNEEVDEEYYSNCTSFRFGKRDR